MKRKKSILLWLVLLVFLTTYNFDFGKNKFNSFFLIKKIDITETKFTKKDVLENKLESLRNKNLIFVKKKDFTEILKDLYFIKEIEIKKIYPNKIKIIVKEVEPIAYFIDNKKKYLLTTEKRKIIKYNNQKIGKIPLVVGKNADEKFETFYSALNNNNFNMKLIKQFSYFNINRWDIILNDGKVIKLPSKNYEKSIIKFLSIYKKGNFNDYKVFDFRIDNQLILK